MPVGQLSHGVMRWRWWAGGGAARRVASGGGVGLEVAWHGGQRRAEAAAPGGGGVTQWSWPQVSAQGVTSRGSGIRRRRCNGEFKGNSMRWRPAAAQGR
jgi:hypothetical protein